jgi:hypothetical protein
MVVYTIDNVLLGAASNGDARAAQVTTVTAGAGEECEHAINVQHHECFANLLDFVDESAPAADDADTEGVADNATTADTANADTSEHKLAISVSFVFGVFQTLFVVDTPPLVR